METTPGVFDTPGFKKREKAAIEIDFRHTKRLYLKRNHNRIVQSSTHMLQAWRGNCDIQILIYDSDPDTPNPADIARVTDYVVAYSSEGNKTLKEENEVQYHTIFVVV